MPHPLPYNHTIITPGTTNPNTPTTIIHPTEPPTRPAAPGNSDGTGTAVEGNVPFPVVYEDAVAAVPVDVSTGGRTEYPADDSTGPSVTVSVSVSTGVLPTVAVAVCLGTSLSSATLNDVNALLACTSSLAVRLTVVKYVVRVDVSSYAFTNV